jgi:predicted TIM-barrel fold metal-dependent hydrolase
MPRSVLDGGAYVIQCAAGLEIPSIPKLIDMETKLRDMDDMKIDVAVLSHGIPFGPDVLGGDDADDWAVRINDDLARIVAMFPGRFVGLGAIGFGDRRRSTAEVDRCVRELGFRGFQVFSNMSNRGLDFPEMLPVLKHIAKLGVPVHLHPAIPLNRIGLDAPSLFLSLGFPCDTSLNIVRLIRSGIFDAAPDLKIIVAHAGGVIPYLFGRIATYGARSALISADTGLAHPIEHYLSRLFVDTVCYHKAALECCCEVIGVERMLYGTDHPFGRYDVAAELVDRLDRPAADKEMIWHGNAERLLKLQTVPVPA